jgi:hypothetical protein
LAGWRYPQGFAESDFKVFDKKIADKLLARKSATAMVK